jgi:lipoprotein-anchoring transpeptidase ErfK/SrfK
MRAIRLALLAGTVTVGACRTHPVSVVVPEQGPDVADLAPISARGDTSWRASAARDRATHVGGPHVSTNAGAAAPPAAPRVAPAAPATGLAALSPELVNAAPAASDLDDDEGSAILHAQVLLDRARFSSGVLNGKAGQNMSKAVYFFQEENGLPSTGRLDSATYDKLLEVTGRPEAVVQYTLTREDVRGPYFWIPASVYAQADLPCECYASALEMLDERFHTVTDVLRRLNPTVNFGALTAGTSIWVPNVEPFDANRLGKATDTKAIVKIHVAKNGRYLHALAADGSIVFHFPTTVGSEYDPSPSGVYHVTRVQWHPVFHYDPSLYSDVPDSRPRATLPPGPNSPVGIVWIATTKEHVGIHGTPLPHTIGLASSHGCVRLANWDAARLAAAVHAGVTIEFVN